MGVASPDGRSDRLVYHINRQATDIAVSPCWCLERFDNLQLCELVLPRRQKTPPEFSWRGSAALALPLDPFQRPSRARKIDLDRHPAPISLARYLCSVRASSTPMVIRRAIYRLVRIGLVNAVMGRRRRRAVRGARNPFEPWRSTRSGQTGLPRRIPAWVRRSRPRRAERNTQPGTRGPRHRAVLLSAEHDGVVLLEAIHRLPTMPGAKDL